jgi:hypothetical protein
MENINVAPLWQILFPLTNQMMDILEAPTTRKYCIISAESRPKVTVVEPKPKRAPLPSHLAALAEKYHQQKALLTGKTVNKTGRVIVEVPRHMLRTRRAEKIAQLFVNDGCDSLPLEEVAARLNLGSAIALRYHVKENHPVFRIEGGRLIVTVGVTKPNSITPPSKETA